MSYIECVGNFTEEMSYAQQDFHCGDFDSHYILKRESSNFLMMMWWDLLISDDDTSMKF
jgi:hypothetical protein